MGVCKCHWMGCIGIYKGGRGHGLIVPLSHSYRPSSCSPQQHQACPLCSRALWPIPICWSLLYCRDTDQSMPRHASVQRLEGGCSVDIWEGVRSVHNAPDIYPVSVHKLQRPSFNHLCDLVCDKLIWETKCCLEVTATQNKPKIKSLFQISHQTNNCSKAF